MRDAPGEILAFHELHRQGALRAGTGQAIGIGGEGLRQHFKSDVAIQLRIARAIHLAHTAFAE